jgi:thymidylate synthase (FAD)
MTGNEMVDDASKQALDNLQKILQANVSNDIAKFCLPESYKTELTWSINARSLQNFLHLRTNKAALWEIRDLANMIYVTLPDEHKYLFEDHIENDK